MTEAEVLEKLAIFKDALIKKNNKIKELEEEKKKDEDLIEGLTNSNEDFQNKIKANEITIKELVSGTEKCEQLEAALDERNIKIKALESKLQSATFELSETTAKAANLTLDLKDASSFNETLSNERNEWEKKYNDLKDKTYKTIKHLVEDVIEKQEKEINELKSRKIIHDTSADVDDMMEKIHTTDVDTSAVDETMTRIKRGQKLFKQYGFGVANEDTLKLFIDFVNNIYENSVKKDRYYIINHPDNCRLPVMTDNTYNTFMKFLIDNKLIESRLDGSEFVSLYSKEEVCEKLSKEC